MERFLNEYIDGRADVKQSSKLVWGHVRRNLIAFFGGSRGVETITPGDSDDFKQWLIRQGLAAATIHKTLQFARSLFRAMVRRKLVGENPFAEVKSPASGSSDRLRFVTRAEITRLLEFCPDHHWKMILVLSRFGGSRCPSEVLSRRWQDIDWEGARINEPSLKTAHHVGKDARTIPIFPELREALEISWEAATDGAVYVVDERFRSALGAGGWANCNMRTTLQKMIRRAGLKPWPRLFHDFRASRETELSERFPVHVVVDWLGNTPSVAMRHYLMVTDEHFTKATKAVPSEAAQNPAQQMYANNGNDAYADSATHEKTPAVQGFANKCEMVHICGLEDRGHQ